MGHAANETKTLTLLYHVAHRKVNIRKETSASVGVFSIASFISMSCLMIQLHLTREMDIEIPLFLIFKDVWLWVQLGIRRNCLRG